MPLNITSWLSALMRNKGRNQVIAYPYSELIGQYKLPDVDGKEDIVFYSYKILDWGHPVLDILIASELHSSSRILRKEILDIILASKNKTILRELEYNSASPLFFHKMAQGSIEHATHIYQLLMQTNESETSSKDFIHYVEKGIWLLNLYNTLNRLVTQGDSIDASIKHAIGSKSMNLLFTRSSKVETASAVGFKVFSDYYSDATAKWAYKMFLKNYRVLYLYFMLNSTLVPYKDGLILVPNINRILLTKDRCFELADTKYHAFLAWKVSDILEHYFLTNGHIMRLLFSELLSSPIHSLHNIGKENPITPVHTGMELDDEESGGDENTEDKQSHNADSHTFTYIKTHYEANLLNKSMYSLVDFCLYIEKYGG